MIRVLTDVPAAERTRWLAELGQALADAQELVTCLAVAEGGYIETLDVCARLEAARAEVQSLRRAPLTQMRSTIDSNWRELTLWESRVA